MNKKKVYDCTNLYFVHGIPLCTVYKYHKVFKVMALFLMALRTGHMMQHCVQHCVQWGGHTVQLLREMLQK